MADTNHLDTIAAEISVQPVKLYFSIGN